MTPQELNRKRIEFIESLVKRNEIRSEMDEGGFLDDDEIELLEKWIAELKNTITVEMPAEKLHSVYKGTGIRRTTISGYSPDGHPEIIDITSLDDL